MTKKEMIEECEERIDFLKESIKKVDEKLMTRLDEDVDSYELSSDLGKTRTTRGKFTDYMKFKKGLKKELAIELLRLKTLKGTLPTQVLLEYRGN